METVRAQYERYPYPPVSPLALPRRGQADALSWERGCALAERGAAEHAGARILVAGCGTVEALVVAQAHPRAREIVAVDISASSVARLRARIRLARVSNLILGLGLRPRIPPITVVRADLAQWEGGSFDYIVATDVLHHHDDPAGLLARLASWLRPDGLLRAVTYSAAGRTWMRGVGRWLSLGGITLHTPNLASRARARMDELPADHPFRVSFDANPESRAATGIADAYLHACENPLTPERWGEAAAQAGLRLVAQDHTLTSQSSFVDELWPALGGLDVWSKLGLLDDLLEMVANPVFWFELGESSAPPPVTQPACSDSIDPPGEGIALVSTMDPDAVVVGSVLWLPSRTRSELGHGLRRAISRTAVAGVTLDELLHQLVVEVGPRVDARGAELPGLTIHEHGGGRVASLPTPWTGAQFERLESRLGPGHALDFADSEAPRPRGDLVAQAEHLQLRYGPVGDWIGPLRLR